MFKKTILIAAIAGLLACDRPKEQADQAQPDEGSQPGQEGQEGTQDKTLGELADQEFVTKATSANMLEIQTSNLALEELEGAGPMKEFAQLMVTDHQRVNQELQTLAKQKGWKISEDLAPPHQEMMKRVEDADQDLEEVYRDMQSKAHDEMIKLFEDCTTACNDPQLKAYAERTLKVLKDHERRLEKLSERAKM